jgi:hypothetical protein
MLDTEAHSWRISTDADVAHDLHCEFIRVLNCAGFSVRLHSDFVGSRYVHTVRHDDERAFTVFLLTFDGHSVDMRLED